jgi:metal transporter CNNM
MNDIFIWFGILFCVTQSAMFSGLNLAFFSFTRLRLEIEAEGVDSARANKVLNMRDDSNFLLATILWGNVGINVLLTLLSDSVMAGMVSFLFSTVIITLFGEIIPQAYFSRNSLKMASVLAPVLRIYQVILYPVAKPSALMLDAWLGKESVLFFSEKNIKLFLKKHIEGSDNEIDDIEGIGAINFLSLDDQLVSDEGEMINPHSIISLPMQNDKLVFPDFKADIDDVFIQQINYSGEKWLIFTNKQGIPVSILDVDGFIRAALFCENGINISDFCHKPLVIKDSKTKLDMLIKSLRSEVNIRTDEPIEKDVVLFWTNDVKKIVTGADILGRLLKGI